jgi:hypothetical protein
MIYSTHTVTKFFRQLTSTHLPPAIDPTKRFLSCTDEQLSPTIDPTKRFLSCTDEQLSPPREIDILFNQVMLLGMQPETINGIPEEVMCAGANLFHHYKESYHKGETGLSLLILLQKTDPSTGIIYYRDVFVYIATNICAYCLETKPQAEKPNYDKCSKCKQVRYCSQDCQTNHWHSHKKICLRLDSIRTAIKETEQRLKYYFPDGIDNLCSNSNMPPGSLMVFLSVNNDT